MSDSKSAEPAELDSGAKPVKRACTECRQQKARCDAHIKIPCSRCAKLGVHCLISSPFKREHKRKRLSELEHETAALRQRLQTSNSPLASTHNTAPSLSNGTASAPTQTPSNSASVTQESFPPTVTDRSLGDITVPAAEINELFYIYFRDYHPWLPILEPQVSPDEYYARLPFLFWAIIAVAARRYRKNPTLLVEISETVLDKALLSMKYRSDYFFAVHGALLMLNWPISKGTLLTTSGPLAGAMVQMATQIGLHIPASAQDFARVKLHLSEADIAKRAELWTFVTLLYQRVCKSRGQQGALLEIQHTPQQVKALTTQLSASVKLQSKLEDITTNCDSAFAVNILPHISSENSSSLNTFLKISDSQIDEVVCDAISDVDRFYIAAARLHVHAYYLFEQASDIRHKHHIIQLFRIAADAVKKVDDLDMDHAVLETAPHIFLTTIIIASFVIMRIQKSDYAKFTAELGGEQFFFDSIRLGKRIAVASTDIATRLVAYSSSLWNSKRAFRKADGSDHMALRIKTRLAMSVVYDSAWWFKEEFDKIAMYDEKRDMQQTLKARDTVQDSGEKVSAALQQLPLDQDFPAVPSGIDFQEWTAFDDPTLAEFAWALSDNTDFSFLPTAPPLIGPEMVP